MRLEMDDANLDELVRRLAPRLAAATTVTNPVGLSTAEAAQRAGVHEKTIRRALGAGTLNGRVIAGRWRVAPDALAAWLDAGGLTSAPQTHDSGRPRRQASTGADAIAGKQAA